MCFMSLSPWPIREYNNEWSFNTFMWFLVFLTALPFVEWCYVILCLVVHESKKSSGFFMILPCINSQLTVYPIYSLIQVYYPYFYSSCFPNLSCVILLISSLLYLFYLM